MSKKQSLKYEYNVPEGYDVCEMQYTFEFIQLVLKYDYSIDKAIEGTANQYDLSEDYLMDYLIENRYIIDKPNIREFSKKLKKYNSKTLKRILKDHGLKTSGKRERIEKRILESGIFANDYYLSFRSKAFYKNKRRRFDIFNEYLIDDYYFTEFNEFYMDSFRKKEENIPVEFINLHINKAIEEKSHENYIFNNQVMAEHFFIKDDYRKMLEYQLKNYCMNINPIWKIDNLEGHVGFDLKTYENLWFLQDELSRNIIINTFYLVWDSFDFERIIVSKYDAYRCLKDILNNKDYKKINDDLKNRFYENDNLKIKRITQKTLFDF